MKKINIGLPVLALCVAIAASAFTLSPKHQKHAWPGYTYLQQNKPGVALLTMSSPVPSYGWTDVTDSVDNNPVEYSDEQWHCQLTNSATCVVGLYNGAMNEVDDGISQKF